MLEAATENVRGSEQIEWRLADATALPFEDHSFDAVACQFGVMFFPDKGLGYREAARVLKPRGRFVFNVWDSLEHNLFAGLAHEAVTGLFPDNPPSFLTTPYGYHDLSEIKTELQHVGFARIEFAVLPWQSRAKSANDVARAIVVGSPLAAYLAETGAERLAFDAVEAAVVKRFGSGEVVAPMQSIAIEAKLPG